MEQLWQRFLSWWFTTVNSNTRKDLWQLVILIVCWRLVSEMNAVGENFEQCVGDNMKRNNILDAEFSHVEPFNKSIKICDAFVNIRFMSEVFSVTETLNSIHLMNSEMTCIKSKVNGPMFSKNLYKLLMYQVTKRIPEEKLFHKKEALNVTINSQLAEFVTQCRRLDMELSLFDRIFENSKELKKLGHDRIIEKEYCFKKHLFTHQLLKSSMNLTSFAHFLAKFASYCSLDVIQPYRKNIEDEFYKLNRLEEFPVSRRICFIEQIEETLIIEKLMAVSIAGLYGMTDEDKQIEQQDFKRMIHKLHDSLKKVCQ